MAGREGRVERAIQYIRTSFFPAREYRDLDDLNQQALEWCQTTSAERRSHENDKQLVRDAFESERSSLLGLPEHGFICDERTPSDVGKTPYVRFEWTSRFRKDRQPRMQPGVVRRN